MTTVDLQLGRPFKRRGDLARITSVMDSYYLETDVITDANPLEKNLRIVFRRQLCIQRYAEKWMFAVPIIGRLTLESGMTLAVPTTPVIPVFSAQPDLLYRLDDRPPVVSPSGDGCVIDDAPPPASPERLTS